jgi:hypothetical protein
LYISIQSKNKHMEKLNTVLAAIAVTMLAVIILAWPVQLLWNLSLVPAIDGVNYITFWQALGINVLASILFKTYGATPKND